MKQSYIFILLFLFGFHVMAQDAKLIKMPTIKLNVEAGFASYSFENLKDMNKKVIGQLPFETAVIDNFPSRFYFGGSVLICLADWYAVGPAYGFHSTGSRIGAMDYSGSYHFDQILSTHQLGVENEIKITKDIKPSVFLNLTGGLNISSWKMEEILNVGEEPQEDKNEYLAIKPFVLPALKISYPVYKDLQVFTRAGYLFDLGGKYHVKGNKDYESTLKIPWSCFRVSLGLELSID